MHQFTRTPPGSRSHVLTTMLTEHGVQPLFPLGVGLMAKASWLQPWKNWRLYDC